MQKNIFLILLSLFLGFGFFPVFAQAADQGCSDDYPVCLGTTVVDLYLCKENDDKSCAGGTKFFLQEKVRCGANCSFNRCSSNDLDNMTCTTKTKKIGDVTLTWCAEGGCNNPGNCCGKLSEPTGTPKPKPTPTPNPGPDPFAPVINHFRINNLPLRTKWSDSSNYYMILRAQAPVYYMSLEWSTNYTSSCMASCTAGSCSPDWQVTTTITTSGTKWLKNNAISGEHVYTLTCQGDEVDDEVTASLRLFVKDYSWFEIIPRLDLNLLPKIWARTTM